MQTWSLVAQVTACEGPNCGKDTSGGTFRRDDWIPIEPSQLTGNLAEVFSGMPLTDAKRAIRNNSVYDDRVTITDRGWAAAEYIIAPCAYFDIQPFNQLGSREQFETWTHERFPQAKDVEFLDVIPVTYPHTTTRGYATIVVVTNQQDRKFRCALSYVGYGGPKHSPTSTDIFRLEELKSTLQIGFCTVGGTTTSLNQRIQRVAF
ncbi:MAG: hypothetical protein FJX33_17325 [Alphaproteobacteria bacterium]|nr:hypothetical protein [Alphaproteobacteria bacterium]